MTEEEPKKQLAIGQHEGESRQEDRRVENVTIIKDDDPDFEEECKLDNLEDYLNGTKTAKIKIMIARMEDEVPNVIKFAETLENLMDKILIIRNSKSFALTEDGYDLYETLKSVFVSLINLFMLIPLFFKISSSLKRYVPPSIRIFTILFSSKFI